MLNRLVFLIAILFIQNSCVNNSDDQFYVTLDPVIRNVVTSYVTENKIDLKSRVINLRCVSSNYRTDFIISSTGVKRYSTTHNAPTYYSVVADSAVVFLYTGYERFIKDGPIIVAELDRVLASRKIDLNDDLLVLEHSPRWKYSICNDTTELRKESSSVYDRDEIPCGYVLRQDSVAADSFIVVKQTNSPLRP